MRGVRFGARSLRGDGCGHLDWLGRHFGTTPRRGPPLRRHEGQGLRTGPEQALGRLDTGKPSEARRAAVRAGPRPYRPVSVGDVLRPWSWAREVRRGGGEVVS